MAGAALFWAALAAFSSSGGAFRQETSDVGAKLAWRDAEVTFAVVSLPVAGGEARAVVERALSAWGEPSCASFVVRAAREGERADVEVRVVSPWSRKRTLSAFTDVAHDKYSGAIERAVIELNGDGVPWSTTGAADALDLETVVLHEAGHALGLAHSPVKRAVMWGGIPLGRVKRALADDDVKGLCAIYAR